MAKDKNPSEIIIRKHKHGTDYFDASTPEAKKKALKEIFKENKGMEYYCSLEDSDSKNYLEKAIEKQTDLAALHRKHKEENEAVRAEDLIKRYKEELRENEAQKKLYDLACKGDEIAIEKLLRRRSDYEYESFELETLRK